MPILPEPSRRTQQKVYGADQRNNGVWSQQGQYQNREQQQEAGLSPEQARAFSGYQYLQNVTAALQRTHPKNVSTNLDPRDRRLVRTNLNRDFRDAAINMLWSPARQDQARRSSRSRRHRHEANPCIEPSNDDHDPCPEPLQNDNGQDPSSLEPSKSLHQDTNTPNLESDSSVRSPRIERLDNNDDSPPSQYPCLYPGCRHIGSRPFDLKFHMKRHHPVPPKKKYDCPGGGCWRVGEYGFDRKDHLTEHFRILHPWIIPKGVFILPRNHPTNSEAAQWSIDPSPQLDPSPDPESLSKDRQASLKASSGNRNSHLGHVNEIKSHDHIPIDTDDLYTLREELVELFAENTTLKPMYQDAIANKDIGPDRFERNHMRLLKVYAHDLGKEANDNLQRSAAKFVRT